MKRNFKGEIMTLEEAYKKVEIANQKYDENEEFTDEEVQEILEVVKYLNNNYEEKKGE